jgi:hypothetical protein
MRRGTPGPPPPPAAWRSSARQNRIAIGKYSVALEVDQLAGDGAPDDIRNTIEHNLAQFKTVRVRSVEGEFPDVRDEFTEWRYSRGAYAAAREPAARLIDNVDEFHPAGHFRAPLNCTCPQ